MCFSFCDQNIIAENGNSIFFSTLNDNFQCNTDIHSYMFYTVRFYNKVPEKNCGRVTLYKIHRT